MAQAQKKKKASSSGARAKALTPTDIAIARAAKALAKKEEEKKEHRRAYQRARNARIREEKLAAEKKAETPIVGAVAGMPAKADKGTEKRDRLTKAELLAVLKANRIAASNRGVSEAQIAYAIALDLVELLSD